MLRYSEASGPIARVTRCFGVPALKMFVLDDVNLCKTVACKIDVEHSRFHASRVRRSRMATQHDSDRGLPTVFAESRYERRYNGNQVRRWFPHPCGGLDGRGRSVGPLVPL